MGRRHVHQGDAADGIQVLRALTMRAVSVWDARSARIRCVFVWHGNHSLARALRMPCADAVPARLAAARRVLLGVCCGAVMSPGQRTARTVATRRKAFVGHMWRTNVCSHSARRNVASYRC